MKINEIISEGVLSNTSKAATPNLETWPELDNNNSPYAAYRFGVAMAGAPDMQMDKRGPIGGRFTTIGYSDADDEILKAAAKTMGVSAEQETGDGSEEADYVNKASVVAARKKNKYGV